MEKKKWTKEEVMKIRDERRKLLMDYSSQECAVEVIMLLEDLLRELRRGSVPKTAPLQGNPNFEVPDWDKK